MTIQWKDVRKNIRYVTNSAFVDLPDMSNQFRADYKPTFTIKEQDYDGYYSMERLFLDHYKDPTEYEFVEEVFEGDVKHWEVFKNSSWLQKYYQKWKEKAEAKLLSEAMNRIVTTAFDDSNKNQFQALKYLVERNKSSVNKKAVGRPKKEKDTEEVDSKTLMEDIERLKG